MRADPSTAPFLLTDGMLRLRDFVSEEHRESVEDLVGELVDWRLLRYLEQRVQDASERQTTRRAVIKVNNAGGRPILMPLDRATHPWLPDGPTEVDVGDRTLVLRFVTVAVNVATDPNGTDSSNVLPALLHEWFGPQAGQRGTRHRVLLTHEDGLTLRPLRNAEDA